MKKPAIRLCLTLFALGLIVYLINETPFCYQESEQYATIDLSRLFSPEARPIEKIDPKKKAVVLFLHGFKSCPHDFHVAINALAQSYNVVAPLLPGHGTTPQDLENSNFSQWYAASRDTYLKYRKDYQRVYLCGFSTGGAIALKLGEEFNREMVPAGIIAISAPVFFNQVWGEGVLYNWQLYLSRFFSWFLKQVKEKPVIEDEDDANWVGYQGFKYPVQAHSLKIALHSIQANLGKITSPLLLMQAKGDRTVPFANLGYIARQAGSEIIRTRSFGLANWKHSHHLLPLYQSTRELVAKEILQFINEFE